MAIKIYKNGENYSINCPGGVIIAGTDLEALKVKAGYMYRIFDGNIQWEVVEADK